MPPILRELLIYLSLVVQLGLTITVAVVLGFFGGQWADSRLGSGMTFTVIGVLLGVGAGFWAAYSLLNSAGKSMKRG